MDGGKLCPLIWKEISVAPRNSLNALCFQKIRLENVVSTIHHQEIPRKNIICSVTVWPFLRSKNVPPFFFQGKTFRKFLSLLLIYLPVFWLRISSCHGLSCVHVRASWYEFHCVVCRCGWLKRYLHAAKVQATRVPMLSPFSLFVSVSSFLQYHICMFFFYSLCAFPQIWK